MSNVINQLFNHVPHVLKSKTEHPFILIGRNGELFSTIGISRGCFITSCFFNLISIDLKNNCAVVELLKPLCGAKKLFRTQALVTIDPSCFCGIEFVSIPVFDCLIKSTVIKEELCLPFTLTNTDDPKKLWVNRQKHLENIVTLGIKYDGIDPELNLIFHSKQGSISLVVPKGRYEYITISDLESVETSSTVELVNGNLDIQINVGEKNIIYF
ncbi:CotZ-related putative spore coat protein [Rummeliibacillus pycnus]|uniref:CotZ-related putative spore coat protein n=1 Tax=Rummeliibacillus pycnus TaxID=101070 RepID=UPI001474E20A|nr:CotZ-related putative spore coat protein [Rummeliibacillus pycnus]